MMTFKERNNERVQKLLERDPLNTRAVIANAMETKRMANKLPILDRIFNSVRQQMGFKISFKDAENILKQFETIEKTMDKIIEEATQKEVIRPREVRLKEVKDEIVKMLKDGSTVEDIVSKYKITQEKVNGWIFTIYKEMPELKPQPPEDDKEEKKSQKISNKAKPKT